MNLGQKVKVAIKQLPANPIGIRFDVSQGAAALAAAPGAGHVWRIWVKRVFFGQLFE